MRNLAPVSLHQVRADWERVKSEVAYVRVLMLGQRYIEALRREQSQARLDAPDGGSVKFREDQPRLPGGQTGGGQWTGGGGGSGAGGSGTVGEAPAVAGDKPVQTALVQLAPLAPLVADKAAEVPLYLYMYWASRNSQDATAVLEFNAQEFLPGATKLDPAIGNRTLDQEEVNASCPRNGVVQDLTDNAANTLRSHTYNLRPAEFGTLVHSELKRSVEALNDINFRAEQSVIKSEAERYGTANSVRVDVIENVGDGTVCVYDIKTGKSVLSFLRMQEIADNVHSLFPGTKKILVIEKRPR